MHRKHNFFFSFPLGLKDRFGLTEGLVDYLDLKGLARLQEARGLYDKAMEKLLLAKSHISTKPSKERIDILFDEVWLHYVTGNLKEAFKSLDGFNVIYEPIKDQLEERERENLIAES